MTVTTKTRKTKGFVLTGRGKSETWFRRWSDKIWERTFLAQSSTLPKRFMGSQSTTSEGHPWPPPKGSSGDVGGAFSTSKSEGQIGSANYFFELQRAIPPGTYDAEKRILSGNWVCPVETDIQGKPKWPSSNASSEEEMRTSGATAISRCRPTASTAEASTAVGEIYREGLPHLVGHTTWQDRCLNARNAGSEYLNVKFGWQPLVSEILNFGSAVTSSRDVLNQYRADKGKTIRRQYAFPDVTETTTESLGSKSLVTDTFSSISWAPPSQQGTWYKTTSRTKSRWFSGAFVYGFPQDSTPFGKARELGAEADRLFGISLTPDVLWNLSPWSWAIDWFTNTGDVLSTIGDMASQGLVMRYGYMMEKSTVKVTYSIDGQVTFGKPIASPSSSLSVTTKRRVAASPFGFGFTWDGLSTAQAAILAALGMSRS